RNGRRALQPARRPRRIRPFLQELGAQSVRDRRRRAEQPVARKADGVESAAGLPRDRARRRHRHGHARDTRQRRASGGSVHHRVERVLCGSAAAPLPALRVPANRRRRARRVRRRAAGALRFHHQRPAAAPLLEDAEDEDPVPGVRRPAAGRAFPSVHVRGPLPGRPRAARSAAARELADRLRPAESAARVRLPLRESDLMAGRPLSAGGAAFRAVFATGRGAVLAACGRDAPADRAAAPGEVVAVPAPAAAGSLAPRLVRGPADTVLSWLEPDGDGYALRYATWQGAGWGAARTVARGDDWAVSQADIPSVVPVDGEHWVAHWPVTSAAGFLAYDIAVAVSADGGATWSEPRLLNDDGTATEHGFVSWFPLDGAVGVVWLDGRDLAAEPEEGDEAPLLGTSLRFARLDYGGRVLEQGVIDAVACDCCQTDVVLGAAGPLVVYRDRTAEERRDVVARRFDGRRWSEPLELGADGWIIAGCPVNGPAADALGDTVAVA